ncbi:unnamed protein product [Prorocentrum cordatum]|uniref:Uncharacterized protein n=1 Tax=Prorocentrum cordatum TaxID=2364126 RepID=A0ABN9WSU9_9DINO|nr:unnamed protein product [Polarella glacialis]
MSSGPPASVIGSAHGSDAASEMQRQIAAAAAQQGVAQAKASAKTGIFEIKSYIQENPASVKVVCFLIGLLLMTLSILGIFNVIGAAVEPKHYLNNFYNVFFGVIICICDCKESWGKACFDIQEKLFRNAYLLATHKGRGMLYMYVGSTIIFVLPDRSEYPFWSLIYGLMGILLCILAYLMLLLAWWGELCGCRGRYASMDAGADAAGNRA